MTQENTQHTPGPWDVFDGPNVNGTSHVLIGTDDVWIARMQFGPGESDLSDGELYADARLIAAAPDLLAAADYATRVLDGRMVPYRDGDDPNIDLLGECLRELRDAMRKVEGR